MSLEPYTCGTKVWDKGRSQYFTCNRPAKYAVDILSTVLSPMCGIHARKWILEGAEHHAYLPSTTGVKP